MNESEDESMNELMDADGVVSLEAYRRTVEWFEQKLAACERECERRLGEQAEYHAREVERHLSERRVAYFKGYGAGSLGALGPPTPR